MFKVVNPNSSIYVELSINGQLCVQEFAPGDERAFVVGLSDRASLRVNGVGIAPMQFHVEREDGSIWLIPAYGIADLAVDATHVFGPTPLNARSVIEFCGVRVDATIVEADRLAPNDDRLSVPRLDAQLSRQQYSCNLTEEDEPTLVVMRPVRSREPVAGPIHKALPLLKQTHRGLEPIGAPRLATEPRSSLSDDGHPARGRGLETVAQRMSAAANQVAPLPRNDSGKRTRTLRVVRGVGVGVLVLALAFLVAAHLLQRHQGPTSRGLPSRIHDAKSQ